VGELGKGEILDRWKDLALKHAGVERLVLMLNVPFAPLTELPAGRRTTTVRRRATVRRI
jgi:hypothetical protein